jgi:hypothetical protein
MKLAATLVVALMAGCMVGDDPSPESGADIDVGPEAQVRFGPEYADYAAVIRRPDGHVDTDTMIARLKGLHVTSYAFLIWGWRYNATPYYTTDFDDLANEFLPAAAQAGINVWVYLPSPRELESFAPPPCHGDYMCWADKLGALAAAHPNLKVMVIDDYFAKPNLPHFPPDYARQMRATARSHGAPLDVMPIAYFTGAMHGLLQYNYANAFDGLVFVNLNRSIDSTAQFLPDELGQMNRVANAPVTALNLHMPGSSRISLGDQASVSRTIQIGAGSHVIHFGEGDDWYPALSGANGNRMLQLLVNGQKVWERDLNVPPPPSDTPGFAQRSVDLGSHVTPGKNATLTFRVIATATAGSIPAINVNIYGVSGDGVTMGSSEWASHTLGAGASATTMNHSYRKNMVLMVYASTVGTWTPDASYIANGVTVGHQGILDGTLDGVITYCLDKVDTGAGTSYDAVSSLYQQWAP